MSLHPAESLQDKWEKINGSWYYFDKDGGMQPDNNWCLPALAVAELAENNWVRIKDTLVLC